MEKIKVKLEANLIGEILQDALILSLDKNNYYWVIDVGASFHATSQKDYFIEYVQANFGHVLLGDDDPFYIEGKGKINMRFLNGTLVVLNEVQYIPNLKRNLIAYSNLYKEGFTTVFGENSWKLTKGSMMITKGKFVDTLYLLIDSSICSMNFVAT